MSPDQIAEQEKRVLAIVAVVEPLLDLPGIEVEHKFLNTRNDDDPMTAGDTEVKWEYRWAVIRWYAGVLAGMEDEELFKVVLHEYAHVLLGSMPPAKVTAHEEFATENVCRALLGFYNR